MTKNLDKEGLRSIVDNYHLFYIDLWGVIHNGIQLHKEAINTLREISKKNKNYVLLTNAPRPNSAVKKFLEKMGMDEDIRDHVFTSGEAALNYLKKNFLTKLFFMLVLQEILIFLKILKTIKLPVLRKVNIFYALDYLMILIMILNFIKIYLKKI